MGFCMIPASQKTMSFTIGIVNDETHLYASLYSLSKLWIMDYEVDYLNCGCLFVKSTPAPQGSETVLYVSQANPEAVWIQAKKGGAFLNGIIKAVSTSAAY